MRISTFEQMLPQYESRGLDPDDKIERENLISQYKHSLIVEGEYSELENLHRWIRENIGEEALVCIFYGKTGYDFGFAEYFFENKKQAMEVKTVVPHIYTSYPHSNIPNHVCKSDGYDTSVNYDAGDKNAILFEPNKN